MTRLVFVSAIVAVLGCTTSPTATRLTAAEATLIAERKARSFDPKLDRYSRSAARYDASDHGWWVGYTPKNLHETLNNGFSVLVRDDTREASIVMP